MQIQGKHIVMVANQSWDMASNSKNISIELSRANKVLYVCPPLDRKMSLTKKDDPYVRKIKDVMAGRSDAIEKASDNVWILYPAFLAESANWIPVGLLHDLVNRYNNQKLAESIAAACTSLQLSDIVMINDNVIIRAFYLKEMLRPSLSIYYLRDYLICQPYYKKHGARLEKSLIRKSDMVLANSLYLRDYAAQYNPKSFYVGQGCEIDIFNPDVPLPKPEELHTLKGPVIGYIGYLTSLRLDIELLRYIATTKPEWNIVLVGPENQVFKDSALHSMPNVIFTGNKDPEKLPHYLQHFDVCINPQLLNELTIGNYPRKIDEYLAMGKPTVATRTKAMEAFEGYCYLAAGKEDYITMIESCLNESSEEVRQARIKLARSHNWRQNVEEMCVTIAENSSV